MPDDVVAGGYVPLRREDGKVVAETHGRHWVARPHFHGEPCGDPAILGKTLGLLHKFALRARAHDVAREGMEIKARPFDERFPEECDWAQGILDEAAGSPSTELRSSVDKIAKVRDAHFALVGSKDDRGAAAAGVLALPTIWTHQRFRARTVTRNASTKRVRVDGCEMGQVSPAERKMVPWLCYGLYSHRCKNHPSSL